MLSKEQIKITGATFTPKGLADFLASRIVKHINYEKINVLDPACGEGELLLSLGQKLSDAGIRFSMTGYDENNQYLSTAKERMIAYSPHLLDFVQGDFLNAVDLREDQISLNFFKSEKKYLNNTYDVVIANPPYVRTQILGTLQAQELAKKFKLKGRVDLYYPFLMAMTESLKEGGILGVITSNRYLSTKSGESVRKYLSENFEILELIDLGDTKLFEAAVLPAIFIGRKQKLQIPSSANFIKIYEELNGYQGVRIPMGSIYDILECDQSGYFSVNEKPFKKSSGSLKYEIASGVCWEMLSDSESEWVSKIDRTASNRIEDFFKVKVGIKSTADKVFISEKWEELDGLKPEDELLKELISQENITAWCASDNFDLKVLYPHISVNGKKQTVDIDKYPNAKNYLLTHEAKLRSRNYLIEAGRQWFEMWVPHNPDLWKNPKLVFPDISSVPRFYFDTGGRIVNGNCYWIVAQSKNDIDKLLLIQGISNSKLMTRYHDLVFKNKLYSGRRRYFTQYVEKYPLPKFDSNVSREIISLVKQLNETSDKDLVSKFEEMLEIKVAEAFGVDPIFILD
ncbi:MAG: N-6 DNA methylase [Bacteroidia bacterium]|nr:N-6 DNA methylase [Bacteroidia bacterium]